jgi:4-amino-4-deoxy-L-arabinose transferase-like glycosyltransferase
MRLSHYARYVTLLLLLGAGLRFALFWVNPPQNAFDDHLEPIQMLMQTGEIPAKDACWQCYQPPVFYYLSAKLGKLAVGVGADLPAVLKILQSVSCLAGILGLVVIGRILDRTGLPATAKLASLATACFLPRHVYMSAMHSNDTLTYLWVAVSAYLLILAVDRQFSLRWLFAVSVAATLAVLTKYTGFVVLPMIGFVLVLPKVRRSAGSHRRFARGVAVALLLPVASLALYCASNLQRYGEVLPWNDAMLDPTLSQPRPEGGLRYTDFRPWETIRTPILAPDNIDSFWTLLYSRAWFDMEPTYLYLGERGRWRDHDAWMRGARPFPRSSPLSGVAHGFGSLLIALGLFPLVLVLTGCIQTLIGRWSGWNGPPWQPMFPVLAFVSALGVLLLAIRIPVFSAIKAAYMLNALPAFVVFVGVGVTSLVRWRRVHAFVLATLAVILSVAAVHVIWIVVRATT